MKHVIRHSGVALIEVRDPFLLTEIENDSALQPFLGERLSDRCIAVQPQAVPEIMRRLHAMGHMPSMNGNEKGDGHAAIA